jgi:hypothetical protein
MIGWRIKEGIWFGFRKEVKCYLQKERHAIIFKVISFKMIHAP